VRVLLRGLRISRYCTLIARALIYDGVEKLQSRIGFQRPIVFLLLGSIRRHHPSPDPLIMNGKVVDPIKAWS